MEKVMQELRKKGFEDGKALAIHLIENSIAQGLTLDREQIDCECDDTRTSTLLEPDSDFQQLDRLGVLSYLTGSDSGIDAVLDAVFVGERVVKDLDLAKTRLGGFEKFRDERILALKFTQHLLEKCSGDGMYLPLSVKGSLCLEPDKATEKDMDRVRGVDEQIDCYLIPLLQREIDALGD